MSRVRPILVAGPTSREPVVRRRVDPAHWAGEPTHRGIDGPIVNEVRRRLLLVEDDEVIGEATQTHLQRHDYDVTWETDGLAAWHTFTAAQDRPFDVVLSDVAGGAEPRSLRAAVGRGRDEVGDLADAVDAMAARLAARLAAEQRFTADVAHDLRTPVTGLVTAAALLDDTRPAVLVRGRAAALAGLVEELLEVARLDAGVETAELEHVHLAAEVDRAVGRGVAKVAYPAGTVVVSGDDQATTVLTDPRRLERVLSNLIGNAIRHGRPPVRIATRGRRIEIVDDGPGFGPELLAGGPQRFRSSRSRGHGHGLGLVIASGQAAVLGARLSFDNAPGAGARVCLELPGDARQEGPTTDRGQPGPD